MSLWTTWNPILKAIVMGLILGAGIIGLVMGLTLTTFDWFAHWKLVLFVWPFVSCIPGAAYYVRGPQVIEHLAEKL
jgi:ABC-type phosphate/phosphonate transport system permease subunit